MKEVKRYDPSEDAYGNSKGMKWSPYGDYVLAEDYDALRAENIGMVAQRIAYAGEFPPDQDGLPDTGSIHQNIRKLRAENAELVAALEGLLCASGSHNCSTIHHSKADQHAYTEVCKPLVRYELALDNARAALAKHRGDK